MRVTYPSCEPGKLLTDIAIKQETEPSRPGAEWRAWLANLGSTLFLATALYFYSLLPLASAEQMLCLTVFAAAAVSSIAGFAFSAIAGAALFHFVDTQVHGVQIMLTSSIAIQLYCVLRLRQTIFLGTLLPFVLGGVLGLAPGLYLLLHTPQHLYLLAMGAFLVIYGVFMLTRRHYKIERDGILTRVTLGGLGGITGATAAFPGAFVTIWCNMRGWTKEQQRAIYQPFILVMQIATLLLLSAIAPTGGNVSLDLALYIIPALAGTHIGLRIFRALSQSQFNVVVDVFLVASGIALAAKSF
jgi:uncharacterized membrane protein YfcA